MPETLPAGMPVKRRGDTSTIPSGKVVAATNPNDPPPDDGQQYVRVKWNDGTHEWVLVTGLEPVTT